MGEAVLVKRGKGLKLHTTTVTPSVNSSSISFSCEKMPRFISILGAKGGDTPNVVHTIQHFPESDVSRYGYSHRGSVLYVTYGSISVSFSGGVCTIAIASEPFGFYGVTAYFQAMPYTIVYGI